MFSAEPGKLHGIQVGRGIAALAVVLVHFWAPTTGNVDYPEFVSVFFKMGKAGVDVFFVISGFIIVNQYLKTRHTPLEFLINRSVRIYPAYWVVIATMFALNTSGVAYASLDRSFQSIFYSLTLAPGGSSVLGVAWTLSFEIYFYSLFALAIAFRRWCTPVLGTSVLLIVILMIGQFVSAHSFFESPIVLEFIAGMLLRIFGNRIPQLTKASLLIIFFLAAMLFYLGSLKMSDIQPATEHLMRTQYWGPAAILFVICLVSLDLLNSGRSALVKLGDMSYSLYITHPILVLVYGRFISSYQMNASATLLSMFTAILISIAAAYIFYILVERPIATLFQRCKTGTNKMGLAL